MLIEQATRRERVVHAIADRVAELRLGHPPVQREGRDEVDVVDAGFGGEVEHGFDDALADVGAAHLRQRQAHVVEGDRELHPGEEQLRQRVLVLGMQQRVQDRTVDVAQRLDRLGRVDDAAAVGGELLEAEVLTAPEEDGRGGAIHLEDEAGTGHYRWFSCLRSNATFTAPRRPAAEAWAMASS